MSIVDSLRKLSLKLTGACSTGEDIEDNIEHIAENYSGGGDVLNVDCTITEHGASAEEYVLSKTWKEIYDSFRAGTIVLIHIDKSEIGYYDGTITEIGRQNGIESAPNTYYIWCSNMQYEFTCNNEDDYPKYYST